MESIIATKFNEYLEALRENNAHVKDFNYQIFIDLYKIRESLWIHKVLFNREKDHTISELFQDIIAKYIQAKLGTKYRLILEHYERKCQPDILIQKSGKFISAIEIKTTIGYDRDLIKNEKYKERIKNISQVFNIPENKIIYIFESCSNVTPEFKKIFISNKNTEIKKFIYPLFIDVAHPYNVKKNIKQTERKTKYESSTNEEIENSFKILNLNNFDKIINRIK